MRNVLNSAVLLVESVVHFFANVGFVFVEFAKSVSLDSLNLVLLSV